MFNQDVLKIMLPILAALVSWFSKDRILHILNIKKQESVNENSQLTNVQKALDLWQEMLDDAVKRHKLQISELETIIEKVKSDLGRLQTINDNLELMVKEQRELIAKQSRTISYYKSRYEKNKEKEE